MSIEKIWAREILDSRGNPTVEVDLHTAKGNGHLPTAPGLGVPAWDGRIPSGVPCWARLRSLESGSRTSLSRGAEISQSLCAGLLCGLCVCAPYVYVLCVCAPCVHRVCVLFVCTPCVLPAKLHFSGILLVCVGPQLGG